MSLEELAPLLVYSTEEDIGDYDWDENQISNYVTFWYSPSGNCFQDYVGNGREEAIEDCIKWLDSKYHEFKGGCMTQTDRIDLCKKCDSCNNEYLTQVLLPKMRQKNQGEKREFPRDVR